MTYQSPMDGIEAAMFHRELSGLLFKAERWQTDHPDIAHYQIDDLIDGLRTATHAADHLARGVHYPRRAAAGKKIRAYHGLPPLPEQPEAPPSKEREVTVADWQKTFEQMDAEATEVPISTAAPAPLTATEEDDTADANPPAMPPL